MADNFDISSLGMGDLSEEFLSELGGVEPQEDPKPNDPPADDPADDTKNINPDNSEDDTGDDPVDPESVADKDGNEDGSTSDSSSQPSSPLHSFASALLEEGVLSSLPDDIKLESPEDLVNLMRKEIETREFADLEDEDLEYLKARRAGISRDEYFANKNVLDQLASIKDEFLENDKAADLRLNLIMNDYVAKGMSKEKAVKLAKRSVELGEDIEEAKEALKSIKEAQEKKIQDQIKAANDRLKAQEEKEKAEFEKIKNLIYDEEKEVIPGIKLTKKVRDNIYDSITKVVDKDESGNPMNKVMKARAENKADFEFKIHYLFEITKGLTDFSLLQGAVKSKAIEDFEKSLNDSNYIAKGNTEYRRSSKDLDLSFLDEAIGNK